MVSATQPVSPSRGAVNKVKRIDSKAELGKLGFGFQGAEVERLDAINVTIDNLDDSMSRLAKAQAIFATYTQAQVDAICDGAAAHFIKYASDLGAMAHKETGMGKPEHKYAKNIFAVDYVNKWYKGVKTCGLFLGMKNTILIPWQVLWEL